jgi:hypothetical protein
MNIHICPTCGEVGAPGNVPCVKRPPPWPGHGPWQTSIPRSRGEYHVALQDGSVTRMRWTGAEWIEALWPVPLDAVVVGWIPCPKDPVYP